MNTIITTFNGNEWNQKVINAYHNNNFYAHTGLLTEMKSRPLGPAPNNASSLQQYFIDILRFTL